MNTVVLSGRLTARPELRYTSSNIAYSRFSIAIDRPYSNEDGEKETDFINIIVWRKQAENVAEYLDKGSLVGIEGRLQNDRYTDKDGNNRSILTVLANHVEFLNTKGNNQSSNVNTEEPIEESDPYEEYGQSVEIDDNFLD